MIKILDQRTRDKERKTYRLQFPTELKEESVVAWIRSISGTLRAHHAKVTGLPTVGFELWATKSGIVHRMKVPWTHADYVVAQLRSLVPGIRVNPEDEFPHRLWTRSVEVGLTHTSRPLRIFNAADTSASLLAAVQALEGSETLLLQWVVTPAVPTHPPQYNRPERSHQLTARTLLFGNEATKDEIKDRRIKLEEPNMRAVLRVAATAETTVRASHLIYRVRASLSSTRSPATRFNKRWVSKNTLQKRIDRVSSSVVFPMQLSAPELASLIAWPIGSPFVSGLPPTLSRQLAASDAVPREGRVIGHSNFPGNERPIALDHVSARRHVHVMGPTGVGKTVLLANMMKQDIESGHGVILIENKGDLFESAIDYVPWERLDDVVVLDVRDRKRPVGFNILRQGDPAVIVDELVALFEQLYSDAHGVWTRQVLYHALRTLATDPNLTFVDLAPLLAPMTVEEESWGKAVISNLRDRELRNFWSRFHSKPKAEQDRIVQPVMDRIWQLNARPEIRNIIGQSANSFDMGEILEKNKILLVNLKGLPRDTASLTGTLLMNSIWHAAKSTPFDKPTFLYLDEFQDFLNLPVDPEDMLAKARGFGLGMVMAHQHMAQLPKEMQSALAANARTKIIFQTSATDARDMAREFGSSVSDEDFKNLGRYEAIARIATPDGVSPPLTLASAAPAVGYGFGRELAIQSRRNYGKPQAVVEKEILERRTVAKTPASKRPAIGSSPEWGKTA